MKFGIFIYEPKKVEGFDFDVYRLKPETGRLGTPQTDMYNNIACFGDNVTVREHPDWVSLSKLGPAKRGGIIITIFIGTYFVQRLKNTGNTF